MPDRVFWLWWSIVGIKEWDCTTDIVTSPWESFEIHNTADISVFDTFDINTWTISVLSIVTALVKAVGDRWSGRRGRVILASKPHPRVGQQTSRNPVHYFLHHFHVSLPQPTPRGLLASELFHFKWDQCSPYMANLTKRWQSSWRDSVSKVLVQGWGHLMMGGRRSKEW